ncbi:hypothetical protein ACHAQK_004384 [Fusarium lateritium]
MSNQFAGPATEAETATPRPSIRPSIRSRSRSRSPGPSMPEKVRYLCSHTILAFYRERTNANFEKAKIYEEKAKSHRGWMEKDADSAVKLDAEEAGKASLESVLEEARARAREGREPRG